MGEQQEAYYESKADNALLARIKSLALLKWHKYTWHQGK
jgi:hypothetical protein